MNRFLSLSGLLLCLALTHCGDDASTTRTFTVGGSVSGLSGTVVLQNNAGDDLTVTASGNFTFATAVADGVAYAVTVLTQPSGQTCSVAHGSGTISGANVTNATVTCSTNTYTVGGTITGLSGTLVLQNNGGDNLSLTSNDPFTFATAVADGAAYAVTVSTQPSGQTCSVAHDSGTISGAKVTNVTITCVVNYTVGGTVTALGASKTVVLKNNGGDSKTISSNGSFTFATSVANGATYTVTVSTQPSGQTCALTNATGTISSANVTNVTVTCTTTAPRIFKTNNTPGSGNLKGSSASGIAGADAICMVDSAYPGTGTYKALLVDTSLRLACTSANCGASGTAEHTDWVLAASTTYYRSDGTTTIGTTSSAGVFRFDLSALSASFSATSNDCWTGLNTDWTPNSNLCSNWSNGSSGTGQVGSSGFTINKAISLGTDACSNNTVYLICVEQ